MTRLCAQYGCATDRIVTASFTGQITGVHIGRQAVPKVPGHGCHAARLASPTSPNANRMHLPAPRPRAPAPPHPPLQTPTSVPCSLTTRTTRRGGRVVSDAERSEAKGTDRSAPALERKSGVRAGARGRCLRPRAPHWPLGSWLADAFGANVPVRTSSASATSRKAGPNLSPANRSRSRDRLSARQAAPTSSSGIPRRPRPELCSRISRRATAATPCSSRAADRPASGASPGGSRTCPERVAWRSARGSSGVAIRRAATASTCSSGSRRRRAGMC